MTQNLLALNSSIKTAHPKS